MKKKLFIFAGVLVVIGAAAAGALYSAYPVQMATYAGLTRNYFISLVAPAGTVTAESNGAYKSAGAARRRLPQGRHRRAGPLETGRATTEHSLRSVTRRSARSIRRMSGS